MGRKKRIPAYLHHKQRGKARVCINGKCIQLPGPYGSKESKAEYRRLIDEYLSDQKNAELHRGDCLVVELMVKFLRHADEYYNSDEPEHIRRSLQPLRELYGRLQVDEITPLKIDAIRQHMIDHCKWSRQGVNKAVGRIRRMFKWGVGKELVRVTTYQGLLAVEPLKAGRCKAPESRRVEAVSDAHVLAAIEHMLPEIATMVRLQRLTGMRPSEVCNLRWSEIDRSRQPWIYSPVKHKTAWRGKKRYVFLGLDAQALLLKWQLADGDAYIFSPDRAMQAKWRRMRAQAKQPLYGSRKRQVERRGLGNGKTFANKYTASTYRQAVRRACQKAEVPAWTPYQLRHAKADEVRAEYGLEGVSAVLGNSIDAAQIYAERNLKLAREVAEKCG